MMNNLEDYLDTYKKAYNYYKNDSSNIGYLENDAREFALKVMEIEANDEMRRSIERSLGIVYGG